MRPFYGLCGFYGLFGLVSDLPWPNLPGAWPLASAGDDSFALAGDDGFEGWLGAAPYAAAVIWIAMPGARSLFPPSRWKMFSHR
jgi:hypothetical protein